MIDLTTEFRNWMSGTEFMKLARATQSFWSDVKDWVQIPTKQLDVKNCHEKALAFHAWDRRQKRFPNEGINLFRIRVDNALQDRHDSGYTNGLKNILERFGVTDYEIIERDPGEDADVVLIKIQDSVLSENIDALRFVFQEYGLTRRRYNLSVRDRIILAVKSANYAHNHTTEHLKILQLSTSWQDRIPFNLLNNFQMNNQQTERVTL